MFARGKLLLITAVAVLVALFPVICPASLLAVAQGGSVEPCVAFAAETPGGSGGSDEGDSGNDSSGLLDTIEELIATIKAFVENIGRILRGDIFDIFVEWLGKQLQKTIDPVIGAFGTVFLYTPYLHSHPWVHSWWSWTFWMSFGLLFAATVWAGIRVFTASADPGKDMWKPLKVVGVALVSALTSLYAADFLVMLVNKMGGAILADTVKQVASLGKEINLNGKDDGALILGLMFSSDAALKHPPLLYQMLVPSGFFLLLIIMLEVFILALLALARFFVLCVLAIAAPLYFVMASLTSKMETLVGWWALVARTVLFQLVYAAAWSFCVSVRLAEEGAAKASGPLALPTSVWFGVKATFIEMVILAALIYVTWKYWAAPTWAAVRDPVTLGGGGVLLSAASLASGASRALGLVARTMGNPGAEAAGIKLGEYAGRLRSRGEELLRRSPAGKGALGKLERVRGGVLGRALDRLAPVPEKIQSVEVVRVEGRSFEEGGVKWSVVKVPVGEAQKAADVLKKSGVPGSAVRLDPNVTDSVLVAYGYSSRAVDVLRKAFKKQIPYWTDGSGYVVIQDGVPVHVPVPPDNGVNMGRWGQ